MNARGKLCGDIDRVEDNLTVLLINVTGVITFSVQFASTGAGGRRDNGRQYRIAWCHTFSRWEVKSVFALH